MAISGAVGAELRISTSTLWTVSPSIWSSEGVIWHEIT